MSQIVPLSLPARAGHKPRPIVIGHRGASGYRPEHTLAAYQLAIEQGADFIEPDLVATREGVLVARHENAIGVIGGEAKESDTTDVADRPEFADRVRTKIIDGVSIRGWFTEDFTLAELKTLRAKERIPQLRPQNTVYNGQFPVPTLQEVIDLAKAESTRLGRTIGIYPETKHPSYFRSIGVPLEEALVEALHRNGFTKKGDPIFIQSFEVSNLQRLRQLTELRLVQLISSSGQPWDFTVNGDRRTNADMVTPAGLQEVSQYADGVGVHKDLIVPRDSSNRLLRERMFIADAHRHGLIVHAWTFRSENNFLPADYRRGDPSEAAFLRQHGDWESEYRLFYRLGIDGLFSDNPDHAVHARRSMVEE